MTSVSDCVWKRWPRALELGAQLDVVEDLAVEDVTQTVRSSLWIGWSPPARSMMLSRACASPISSSAVEADAVRPAVAQAADHRGQLALRRRRRCALAEDAGDAAHGQAIPALFGANTKVTSIMTLIVSDGAGRALVAP